LSHKSQDEVKTVILKFTDSRVETVTVVRTANTEEQLQKIADYLVAIYKTVNYEDWSYDDIIDDMESLGFIKVIRNYKQYTIFI